METSWGRGSVRLKAGLSTVIAGFLIALAVAWLRLPRELPEGRATPIPETPA